MPKPKLYLVSVQDPSKRYEVLSFDDHSKTAILRGRYATFEVTPFTKEKVTKDGYKLVTEMPNAKLAGVQEGLQAGT